MCLMEAVLYWNYLCCIYRTSVLPRKCTASTLLMSTDASFHILSSFLFTVHLFRSCIVVVADNFVKA